MNAEIKTQWIAALRGNDYRQGQGVLRSDDGFCCLGVLCDLHAKTTFRGWGAPVNFGWSPHRQCRPYLGHDTSLPAAVQSWAGLDTSDPLVYSSALERYQTLSSANDTGATFDEIAKLIEEQL